MVGKKTGGKRPVFNFRRLNAQAERLNFSLPNIDNHIAALSPAKLFSVLDLSSGYLQIPLDAELRPKTVFVMLTETVEFTRMPFGL